MSKCSKLNIFTNALYNYEILKFVLNNVETALIY
jgi:hypothetical protein